MEMKTMESKNEYFLKATEMIQSYQMLDKWKNTTAMICKTVLV